MKTLAKIYCLFFGHDLYFSRGGGRNVRGRSGRIAISCRNGCGLDYPESSGREEQGY